MKYLLDTNVCIAIIKERPEEVKAKLLKIPIGEIGISSIVLAELSKNTSCDCLEWRKSG